jgi:Ca-activated chloride channel family protein
MAAAASLLLAVAGLYFGDRLASLLANRGAVPAGGQSTSPVPPAIVKNTPPAEHALTSSIAADDPARTAAPSWHADVPKIGLSPRDWRLARGNPAHADPVAVPSNVDPLEEINRWPLAYENEEAGPQPRVEGLVPRGMDWPSCPGANFAFLLKYRVHPFVSPAADPRLQSIVVPLGVDGQSYELARRYLDDKELPPPDLVRTEDFLAAVDYGFTPPAHEALELSLAAGPSPFGGAGLCLLQVGVQAGHVPARQRPAVHLVLAVDTSANMRWNGCLDMVRRALKDLTGQLDAGDRLSLVAFGDSARVVIEDVGPGEAGQFVAAVESLAARGSSNLPEGLSRAYDLARQHSAATPPAVRVVLLTDSMVDLASESVLRIQQQLAEAAGHGTPLHVVDLSQQKEPDPQLQKFAAAAHGAVHAAANADQVRWALREVMTGQSQLVARDAQLRVSFNPKAVLEYRLLGHEATLLAGLLPEHPQADFHDGQSATALYEVRLAPGAGGEIASAELTWYDGDQSRPEGQRRAQQRIELPQFAGSFGQSAASLQAAALVAETAEVLRRSFFVRTQRAAVALARVWELAAQVDSRLAQRPSFREFVALVQEAMKAKPASDRDRARRRSMR